MAKPIIRLAFAVAVLVVSVTGARVKKNDAGQRGPPGFTVEAAHLETKSGAKISWSRGDLFVCVLKWVKSKSTLFRMPTAVKKEEQWYGKTCLANVEDVMYGHRSTKGAKDKLKVEAPVVNGRLMPLIQGSRDFLKCQSSKEPWMMKMCPIKGKRDRRLSYRQKIHVPKSAFFRSFVVPRFKLPVAIVAVDLGGLAKEMQSAPGDQAQWKTEDAHLAKPVVSKLAKPVEASAPTQLEEPVEKVETTAETPEEEPEPELEEVIEEDEEEDDVFVGETVDGGDFVNLDEIGFTGKLDWWKEQDDGQAVMPKA